MCGLLRLNKVMVKNKYLVLNITTSFDHFGRAFYFTKLDYRMKIGN